MNIEFVLAGGVVLAVLASAPARAAEIGEERIGYVDVEKILESVPDIQPARKALLEQYDARRQSIREKEDGLFSTRRALERFRALAWARAESARERAAAPISAAPLAGGATVGADLHPPQAGSVGPLSTAPVLLPGTTLPLPTAATAQVPEPGRSATALVAATQSTGTTTSPLHEFLAAVSTAAPSGLASGTTAPSPSPDAATFSPDDQAEISRREAALKDDEAALEEFIRKSEEEFLEREKTVTQQALGRVYDAIDAVKREGKFTLILDKGLIIHGQEAQDVTPDVVRRLKARRGR